MTAEALRRSPLGDVALPDGAVEVPFLAQVDVRANPRDAAVLDRVAAVLGVALPLEANTVAGTGKRHALWLGPDEWLVIGTPGSEAELERALRDALASTPGGAVVDVSANRTTIELAGPAAREILESGCSIDLHPRAFGPGCCAQTLLARANVVIWQLTSEPRYRLLVRPSFAPYLAAWLADAAAGVGDQR